VRVSQTPACYGKKPKRDFLFHLQEFSLCSFWSSLNPPLFRLQYACLASPTQMLLSSVFAKSPPGPAQRTRRLPKLARGDPHPIVFYTHSPAVWKFCGVVAANWNGPRNLYLRICIKVERNPRGGDAFFLSNESRSHKQFGFLLSSQLIGVKRNCMVCLNISVECGTVSPNVTIGWGSFWVVQGGQRQKERYCHRFFEKGGPFTMVLK